jgi:hypothetical protein
MTTSFFYIAAWTKVFKRPFQANKPWLDSDTSVLNLQALGLNLNINLGWAKLTTSHHNPGRIKVGGATHISLTLSFLKSTPEGNEHADPLNWWLKPLWSPVAYVLSPRLK